MRKIIKRALGVVLVASVLTFCGAFSAFASVSIAISPLYQKLIINPGETYDGSFTVINQERNDGDIKFNVEVVPFYVDENYDFIFNERTGSYNQMVDWVSVEEKSGYLSPNSTMDIHYEIKVPSDAPAGGQYAAIRVYTVMDDSSKEGGLNIKESIGMAYCIYLDVAGTTKKQGEILSVDLPSFLFSGNITGQSSIKNTGNVHGRAKYTMRVYPLFSGEEIYTNEEDPDTMTILPDRTLYNETIWSQTPWFGIFNVVYTVEFEGVTAEVSKMVIVCPLWLLFIIFFAIVMIIAWLIARSRKRGGRGSRSDSSDGGRKIAVE